MMEEIITKINPNNLYNYVQISIYIPKNDI